MRVTRILNRDEVISRCHGSIRELVSFFYFMTAQLYFGRTVDCHSQSSRPSIHSVNDELAQLTCFNNRQYKTIVTMTSKNQKLIATASHRLQKTRAV